VADELARRYPQVRHVRHAIPLGLSEAIQTGLHHTDGEIVLVGDAQHGLPVDDLAKLWRLRYDEDVAMARRQPQSATAERGLIDRLWTWTWLRRTGSRPSPEVQFIRRSAIGKLRVDQAPLTHVKPKFIDQLKAFAQGE
jgi:hypothetical protein